MDIRQPLYQAIASVLAGILILNPIVAAAAELAVDAAAGGNTSIGAAGNGVPIVNIATPGAAGLSHNKFSAYGVGAEGVILNNSNAKTQSTQLGGMIIGNPNLKGGAANRILNEVTGASPSQLRGYTEVAGQAAQVIVANPNGITCNGCGFINTPRVTLTTGKPMLDAGRLQGYDVNGGEVVVEGQGLNASNVDRFEILARAARLNAEIYANQLTVVAGRNQVDAESLAAAAKADDGSARPQLAIDSSALGGMYAGAIRLVGTEQGVGVKLAGNMAASGGDIQIDANGQLSLAQTAAAGSLRANAQEIAVTGPSYAAGSVELTATGQLSNQGQIAAGSRVQLQGSQVVNSGIVEAGVNADNRRNTQGDVAIVAQQVRNSGSVMASRTLDAKTAALDNQRGASLRGANTTITSTTLSNQGRVLADNSLTLSGQQLNNAGGEIGAQFIQVQGGALDNRLGLFSAQQSLDLNLASLDNRQGGTLSSRGALVAQVSGLLDNSQSGNVISDGAQQLRAGQLNNQGNGLISSRAGLSVQADALDNRGGTLVTDAALTLAGGSLDNRANGVVSARQGAQLNVDSLRNAGTIQSEAALGVNVRSVENLQGGLMAAKGALSVQADAFEQSGELLSEAGIQVLARQFFNRQGGWIGAMQGIDLRVDELFNQGEISSRGTLGISAARFDNSAGHVTTDGALVLAVDALKNQAGSLVGQGGISVTGATLDNSQKGELSSQGNVTLQLAQQLDNHAGGRVISEGALDVNAAQVDNRGGILSSAQGLKVQAGSLNNQGGKLLTDGSLNVVAQTLDNQAGVLSAKGQAGLFGSTLLNGQAGRIASGAELLLNFNRVDNGNQGRIESAGWITGQLRELTQQGGGQLVSQGGIRLDLQGGALDNSQQGLIASAGALELVNLARLDNSAGGEISSQSSFSLDLAGLNNQGGRIVSGDELLLQVLGGVIDNSQAGVLFAQHQLSLETDNLINADGGTVASQGGIQLQLHRGLDNRNDGAVAAGDGFLHIQVGQLDNQGGSLSGARDFYLLADNTQNQGGRITAQGQLNASAANLDNRDGIISGAQGLALRSAAIDNRAGLITTQGQLDLLADRVNNSKGGELSAGDQLKLHVDQLIQQQGRLITGADLSLDMAGGDLDNRGGVLSVAGLLLINNLRHLDNRGGEISSQNSFQLRAASIDNGDQGRLISAGTLNLDVEALRNANQGLLSGWQGLSLNGSNLDNSRGGTVSSKLGGLDITLSGVLNNRDQGAFVSQGYQVLRANHLNNQGGIVSSQQDLELVIGNTVDNSAGGLISAQRSLHIGGAELNNASGEIGAKQLQIDTGDLRNTAGRILSQDNLNLFVGILDNTRGQIASGGDLLSYGSLIDNRGGQLASQGWLNLFAGRFDNSDSGTLAAEKDLSLTLIGDLLNGSDGLIYSKSGQLDLSASGLDNERGSIQGQGDIILKTQGAITNQSGRIVSQAGNLDLSSESLENGVGGILASLTGALRLVTGWFGNNGGITQAQRLDITANAGLDNRSGHLSAISGDNRISTTTLDNQGGGLYAGQTLAVSGDSLLNQGGQIGADTLDFSLNGALNNAGGLIESSRRLTLAAGSIDNQNGRLRDLGQGGVTTLSTGYLDNRNGRLESANTDLALNLGGLANDGGTFLHVGTGQFGVSAGQILQAGGSFITTGRLDISADSWSNSSVLQAGWLNLNIGQFTQTASGQLLASQALTGRGGNWNNDGLLASDGTLDIQLTGTYSGAGRVTSLGDLSLSAGQLDIGQGASVTGGQNVTLGAGTLNNHGRLTAANNLTANTGALNNYATLGSTGQLRINTWDLLNDGQQSGALIFSGDDMTLRVGGTLTNRYADIYSLGGLDLAANDAGGRTARLDNLSANIESQGDMRLNVGALNNQRVVLVISQDGKYTAQIVEVNCYKYLNDSIADCSGKRNGAWEVTERDRLRVTDSSAGSAISAGGNLTLSGDSLTNASSTISAGQNLYASLASLSNTGVETGDTETFYVLKSQRTNNMGSWSSEAKAFTDRYWIDSPHYVEDPAGLAAALSHFIGRTEQELTKYRTVTQLDSGDQTYAAIIQAAGDVSINASERIDTSVIRNHTTYVNPGQKTGDTSTGDSPVSTVVTLNTQLPPDLAQQQVNPISLPGFSLPTGSNGLFRLSGQEGSAGTAQSVAGGDSYSFSGQSIGLGQRERALSGADGVIGGIDLNDSGTAQTGSAAASLSVAQVQGVPSSARPDNSHKYLIETNPELTSLKSFLGSDYLLDLLGYDPDKAQKRLGDGLYEQRLIRDAVIARTGQRFIDGITSDQDLFKYLMDNAIAYKDQVHLQLGVALSAEQVAALTHDIVWLEEAVVNGEKVLVPVLYLAQAEGRLAPNGALIQGRDVSLISGGDLANQGTLRASGDLSATAANIGNSGLIEAAGRLDLLALDSIRNTQGGIIKGRDVSLTALTGDVINDRSITRIDSAQSNSTWTRSFADNAARIEGASTVSIVAGRDISTPGAITRSGGDLTMQAGRDINLHSVELQNGQTQGRNYHQTTEQLTGDISAGRDLDMNAGRDLNAIATRIDAARDLAASAGRDVTLASAADEQHSYSQSKKVTAQEDHVHQVSTELNAGGDVLISAGNDLTLISSKISAGNEAYLVAGDKVQVLAANDSDYSLYDKKEKGSFGKKKTQHDEVTDVTAVSSEIKAGSDITVISGGDQTYQAAKLDSGGDIAIVSGGSVTFEAAKDLHQEAHSKENSDLAWTSSSGKGSTDETLRQTQMIAQGDVVIRAVDGLRIDLKQIDQNSVSQTIDAMVQADPQLAWIKQAEARGDVDWRLVKEIHDSYKYSNSGLGAGSQIVIAIVMAAFVGPAALGALGTAGASAAVAAGGAAVAVGASTNAAVSAINNKGNLGKVVKNTTSSDAMKGYAIAGVTAGVTAGVYNKLTDTYTDPSTGKISFSDPATRLDTWQGIGQFAVKQGMQNATNAALSQALGQGGSFDEAFKTSLYNTLAAVGFNAVGDYGQLNGLQPGSPQMIALHALMGGLAAEASGGDFKTGALAGGANEALVDQLTVWVKGDPNLLNMMSQLVGVVAASTQSGTDADSLNTGKWVAESSTQYNYLEHTDVKSLEKDMASCSGADAAKCQEQKWASGGYDAESQELFNDAMNTSGSIMAKYRRGLVANSLDALVAMPCSTSTCEGYKATLIERALTSYVHLSNVIGEWAPSMDRFSLIAGGAIGGKSTSDVRPAGTPSPAGITQFEKAVEYWKAVRAETVATAGAKGVAPVERAPLPTGYREGPSVGAGIAETAGLPDGYRRVINTKTGNTEVLATDGKLYLETGSGLQPKAGGNLAGLVEAEKNIATAKEPTRFIDGVTVVDRKTGNVFQGTVDLGPTLDRIKLGGSYPHRNDGSIFQNRLGDLPVKPVGYYTEYVHPTPGVTGPGSQRIVVGKGGEMYYTADHYKTFIPINK